MSKQKILPVEPLIQCEAGRAKTMPRQSLYSPRTPKWPPSDKGEYTCQLFLRYRREIFILGVLGFLKTTRSFPKIPEEFRSLPKKSEDVRSLPNLHTVTKAKTALAFPSPSLRTRINASPLPVLFTRKVSSFIHFTHGFRSLRGSELTYFWKLCQARRQQLTFFNQA